MVLRREDVPLPTLSGVIDGWADELDARPGLRAGAWASGRRAGRGRSGDRLRGDGLHLWGAGVAERRRGSARPCPRRRFRSRRSDGAPLPDSSGAAVPRGRVRRRRVAVPAAGRVGRLVPDRQLGHRLRGESPGGVPTSSRCCRNGGTSTATARSAPVSGHGSPCRSCRDCPIGSGSCTCAGTSTRPRAIPQVPRLTAEQVELLDLIDALAQDPELHLDMDFVPGDIQWLANRTILHSRTAYEDSRRSGSPPPSAAVVADVAPQRGRRRGLGGIPVKAR